MGCCDCISYSSVFAVLFKKYLVQQCLFSACSLIFYLFYLSRFLFVSLTLFVFVVFIADDVLLKSILNK